MIKETLYIQCVPSHLPQKRLSPGGRWGDVNSCSYAPRSPFLPLVLFLWWQHTTPLANPHSIWSIEYWRKEAYLYYLVFLWLSSIPSPNSTTWYPNTIQLKLPVTLGIALTLPSRELCNGWLRPSLPMRWGRASDNSWLDLPHCMTSCMHN